MSFKKNKCNIKWNEIDQYTMFEVEISSYEY